MIRSHTKSAPRNWRAPLPPPTGVATSRRKQLIRNQIQRTRARSNETSAQESSLDEFGFTEDEKFAERAWDALDTDPMTEDMSFDELYGLDDNLPVDLKDELLASRYGPPVVLAAGFRLEEYAVIRMLLDTIGAQHVKVIPCSAKLLHGTQQDALYADEPKWDEPRPADWMLGGAWGSKRVCMFGGLSIAQQGTIVELLEGEGVDHIAVCAAVPESDDRVLGQLLAEAVQADKERAADKGKPTWAMDVDPSHVGGADLPDLEKMLGQQARERLEKLRERVQGAENADDVADLNADLDKEEQADVRAFLQGLVDDDKMDGYLKDEARRQQALYEGVGTPAGGDGDDSLLVNAEFQDCTEAGAGSAADTGEQEAETRPAADDTGAAGGSGTSGGGAAAGGFDGAARVNARAAAEVGDAEAGTQAAAGQAPGAAPALASLSESLRAARRSARSSGAPADFSLDDVIAGGVDVDVSYQEGWLDERAGLGGAPGQEIDNALDEAAGGDEAQRMIDSMPLGDGDTPMDAITRALKSGVDAETLKRYIDEAAQRVAGDAGSWVEDSSPQRGQQPETMPASGVVRGSSGEPLQYGPQEPAWGRWDPAEEARREREQFAQQARPSGAAAEPAYAPQPPAPAAVQADPPAAATAQSAGAPAAPPADPVSSSGALSNTEAPAGRSGGAEPRAPEREADGEGEALSRLAGLMDGRDVRLTADSREPKSEGLSNLSSMYRSKDYSERSFGVPLFDEEDQQAFDAVVEQLAQEEAETVFDPERHRPSEWGSGWDDDLEDTRDDAPQQVGWQEEEDASAFDADGSSTMTVSRADLEETARRHGLNVQDLLDDAASKGVTIV